MKHKGSCMEHCQERIDELMKLLDWYIDTCDHIVPLDACKVIVNKPASRFWVSSMRARNVVSAIMRGTANLDSMNPLKREMYLEIYHRVMELQKKKPDTRILDLCSEVVCQPAPKFYLSPGSARVIISKSRKEWLRRKMQRLQRL